MFHADLHIHSRYSRACSKHCDIEHLAWWALRKGITVLGTGDFTHPAWAEELNETLIPAEPGLFRLRDHVASRVAQTSPASCAGTVRFMLSSEISTIYRRGERTRKVHHLIYAPTFEAAARITTALSKIGNLASDGRPILGLDSRDLLEIVLDGGPGCYLIPAHVWTPWFAVLGSKSGFDLVADCYGDLADEIFAIETGLSSDPAMNWRCSSLDRYRLVSNSDAHSPPMLGREATTFGTAVDYFAMASALRTGNGLIGTIEFYPEEGKYHLDGHRKCGVRLDPRQTRQQDGHCPRCGQPLTVGVLNRVTELADRPEGYRPPGAPGFTNLVQLRQIVGEILAAGPQTKKVSAEVTRLVAALGPELEILTTVPLADLSRTTGSRLTEAIGRLRRGEVRCEAGFDGEYGVVRLFGPGELGQPGALFELPEVPGPASAGSAGQAAHGGTAGGAAARDAGANGSGVRGTAANGGRARGAAHGGQGTGNARSGGQADLTGEDLISADLATGGALDADQLAAVQAPGPLMIVAGPGAGKTRTLAYRIAAQLAAQTGRQQAEAQETEAQTPLPTEAPPGAGQPGAGQPGAGQPAAAPGCLAVTFTRRAAAELQSRLAALVPAAAARATVTTFHGLGLRILREFPDRAGLTSAFQVADEAAVAALAANLTGSARAGRKLVAGAADDPERRAGLVAALRAADLTDFDGLIKLPVALLREDPSLAARLRERWPLISVDEYQDIDATQYELLRLLAGDGRGLTVIGDPDQAIYGFRGADVGFFLRFGTDFPGASCRELSRSYRATEAIVAAASAAVAPATLVPGRELSVVRPGGPAITLHETADEQAEAGWITAAIDQLLGGSSFHSIDSGRADGHDHGPLSLRDVAILYRTDGQAAALGQALVRAGLPFQKGSHDLLARRSGVQELIAELRLPGAAVRPPGAAAAPPGDGTVAGKLRAAARRLAVQLGGPRATDIRAASEVLLPLARRCADDLDAFLAEIALGAQADALDPRADAVTLLTLHAAKGLEFDVVFLAGCERGLLPLWLPGQDPGHDARTAREAEERRLLFVGMTRARNRLYLSCAAQRARRGGLPGGGGPSPFLAGLDPGLLRRPAPPRPRRPATQQLRLL